MNLTANHSPCPRPFCFESQHRRLDAEVAPDQNHAAARERLTTECGRPIARQRRRSHLGNERETDRLSRAEKPLRPNPPMNLPTIQFSVKIRPSGYNSYFIRKQLQQ